VSPRKHFLCSCQQIDFEIVGEAQLNCPVSAEWEPLDFVGLIHRERTKYFGLHLLIMSSDLLLSHISSVKSHISLSSRNAGGKDTLKKQKQIKESSAEKGARTSKPERIPKEKDYAREARAFLSQKKARIEQRVQLVNLSQPAKKNRKKLKKLIKLAKAV
jgi:hypothetical protein